LSSNHACRVWAAEAIHCFLACPDEHLQCDDSYFKSGKGPIFPVGLAFNDFRCAVCKDCAAVCATTPNFAVLCGAI
jgi:Pyruvate/2-oxoacid:ferredoxin oxidoreductase delta subunit